MTQASPSPLGRENASRLHGPSRLLSDDRLAHRATKGDERALAAIYRRYHQDLYRFCLAIVGNPQDAQDALQNTMVKVLRALPGEERRIQLKPWLYRIAHNEAVELLRKRRDSVQIEPELTASGGELAETVALRERLRCLLVDLAKLPDRQRAALVMRELGGLGFAQIGAAFDTSDAVARQTVYEARLSLRQMEEGREMSCKQVTWELSEADGRTTRRRDIQAHLRACPECRAFGDAIAERRSDLAAIAPLPLATAAGLLHGVLGGSSGAAAAGAGASAGTAAGGGLAGTVAVGAGKTVATSAIVKSAATVAVVVAVGAGAADRGGLIETPLPSSIGGAKSSGPVRQGAAAAQSQSDRDAALGTGDAAALHRSEGRGEPDGKHRSNDGRSAPAAKAHGRSSEVESPPGSGHGRPDGLPAAAGHGQETAAAHSNGKPPGSAKSKSGGKSTGRSPGKGHPARGSHAGGRGDRSGGRSKSASKGKAPKQPAAPPAPAQKPASPPPADSSAQSQAPAEVPSP